MDSYVGWRKKVDADVCKAIVDRLEESGMKLRERIHGGRKHTATCFNEGTIGIRGSEFWKPIEHIFDKLEQQIYPYENKIYDLWINVFEASDDPSKPAFMPLHMDGHFTVNNPHALYSEEHMTYISSVLLDRSDDLEGGEFVIAGDSYTDVAEDIRGFKPDNLGFRLKVLKQKEIGDTAQWNCFSVHGVAEITKGKRVALVVLKRAKR